MPRRVVLCGTAAAMLLSASIALAVPPSQERIHFENDVFPAPAVSANCHLPVVNILNGDIMTKTYFDQAGNVTRTVELAPGFKHTWMNTANGRSVTTGQPYRLGTAFNADGSMDITFSGLVYRIKTADGVLAKNAGRLVIHVAADGTETVTHDSGPEDPLFPALCQALTG